MEPKGSVKERLKDRVRSIMTRWRKRQGPFTLKDMYFRDKILLLGLSGGIYRLGITANHITFAGLFLIFFWYPFRMFFAGQILLWIDLTFITLIELTDFFDGSVARNNDDITILGTVIDYLRDFLFLLLTAWVALQYGAPIYIFWVSVGIKILAILIKCAAFIWYGAGPAWRERWMDFVLDNFQSSAEHRFHFVLLCLGLPYIIWGEFRQIYLMAQLGYVLVWGSLVAGALVLWTELNWTPPIVEEN